MKSNVFAAKGIKLGAFAIAMLMIASFGIEFLAIGLVLGVAYAAWSYLPAMGIGNGQKRRSGVNAQLVMLGVGALAVLAVALAIAAVPGPAPIAGADDGAPRAATYKGIDYCKTCHGPGGFGGDQYTGWRETGHGTDFSARDYHGDKVNLYTRSGGSCQKCHTLAYNQTANGGWDPAQAWNSTYNTPLQNVQCENCHGPGSAHSGGTTGIIAAPTVNQSCNGDGVSLCHGPGGHDGPMAGTTPWWNSLHSPEDQKSGASTGGLNSYCAKCKSPTQWDPKVNYSTAATISKDDWKGITCYDCHDMHGDENEAQLKHPKEEACTRCHTSEATAAATKAGSYPHHPQKEMFAGTTGAGVTGTKGMVGVTCVDCHMWFTPSPTRGVYLSTYTGYPLNSDHSMTPTAEACVDCHSNIIMSMPNYTMPANGAGTNATNWTNWEKWLSKYESEVEKWEITIEDWQSETEKLLEEAIEAGTAAKAAIDSAKGNKTKDDATIAAATAKWQMAFWNYMLVEEDKSMGVHNHKFAVELLEAAIGQAGEALAMVSANSAPVANAGPSQVADAGATVTFDASASSDMEGPIASYFWDFGDGANSTDKVATHAYAESGLYTVKLTVTDSKNAAASTTINVFVNKVTAANIAPVAMAGNDQTTTPGTKVSFNGSGSTDADGTIASYSWSFGDGTSGTGATAEHTYANAGVYAVVLIVTDDKGASAFDVAIVSVQAPPAPPVDLTPIQNNLTALKTDLNNATSSVNSVKTDTAAVKKDVSDTKKDVSDTKKAVDAMSGNLGMYMAVVLIIAIVVALVLYMMAAGKASALQKQVDGLKGEGK
jgi:predicted CXXCH cytochrome family protein